MEKALKPIHIDSTVKNLLRIKSDGVPWSVEGVRSCAICGKPVGPIGKKIGTWLTCQQDACEVLSTSGLTKVLHTAYGPAIHLDILAVISRVYYFGSKVVVVREPIVARALALAEALEDLVSWQIAYDAWERQTRPDAWAQGRIQVVPPRYLDEVRAWRAMSDPVVVDPTWRISEKQAREIRRLRQDPMLDVRAPMF
jgi:hypothetical protein